MTRRQAVWLAVIVAAGIAVRLAYLYSELHAPGFQWEDPDGYLRQAAALTKSGHWQWTRQAVDYYWAGRRWELPPGYPVFLSIFYRASSANPVPAAVAQCVVGGLAALALFVIARFLHTVRAGLIAAAAWAFWFPSIANARIFVQEQLYLPLLWTSFAVLAWSLARPSPRRLFAAGVAMSLAALTRAMPLFFIPVPLAAIWWAGRADRRALWPHAAAFLTGLALLVVPYVIWLSLASGQLVIIDNHMMILQSTGGSDPRSVVSVLSLLGQSVRTELAGKASLALGMFKLYGPNWLYHYGGAESAGAAWRTALFVHLGTDTLFLLAAVLAPLGFVLARRREVSLVLLSWIAFVVAISVAIGFSGARYRNSIEAMLICAGAVVFAGQWRRPPLALGAAGAATSAALALVLLPQYSASWRASVPYGLNGWAHPESRGPEQTFARGAAAFYTATATGRLSVELEGWRDTAPGELAVRLDGVDRPHVFIAPGRPTAIDADLQAPGIAFVELVPVTPSPGSPLTYYIRAVR